MPGVTWQLYPPRLHSVLWQPAAVKTCWDHGSSMISWQDDNHVFVSTDFCSIDRNKQCSIKERRNLGMDKCFVETLQGSTECLKVNSEKRSNEGNKVKQPEEDGITQEMAEETRTRRKATTWTKHIKSPQCVKGVHIRRYNFGVNTDGKTRLKPTYRVRPAWEETHWPFHGSYMCRRAIWMG